MNLPTNTITFSHNDLDGVGVGVVVKSILGRHVEVNYCSYDNVDERINNRLDEISKYYTDSLPFILIADLGIKPETAQRLNHYGGGVIVLEHHISNQDMANKYSWFIVDPSKCGTMLVYEYFAKTTKMIDFVTIVNDFDLWIHNDPRSKKHNQLFFMRSFDETEERWLTNSSADFTDEEEAVLAMEERRINKHFDKMERYTNVMELHDGQRVGVVYCDSYTSETGHELLHRLELAAVIMVDANNRKLSLRSRPHFDVSTIAKELGGGGHKNAAGVNLLGTNTHIEQSLDAALDNAFVAFSDVHEDNSCKEFEVLFGIGMYE